MNMNMKKSLIALLASTVAASATPVFENQNLLESKVDSINAKRGVEFGGSIRGVAEASYFSTDQDPSAIDKMPDVEKDEFVTADLDFHFRPYENVRANVMMRLEAGMQEYFASAAKSISVEWINVEGNVGKSFYWIVGDFRQQYTPLTLFLPGVDVMYEPLIFARQRHMAEKSQLIEGNQRNLQGANFQFRHTINPMVGELRAEALLARLNRTAVLDLSGAEGNILPNEEILGASQASNMDKWLAAGNFELFPVNKNLYVGATGMYIFDNEDSFSYTERHPGNDVMAQNPVTLAYDGYYERQAINPTEPDAQQTTVISARLGGDIAGFMENKNLTLDVTGEFAMSMDKVYSHAINPAVDETGAPVLDAEGNATFIDEVSDDNLNGMAILANINAGYKTSLWGAQLAVNVIFNDSNWFNNLAQSPSFFAQRILNTDMDGGTVKYGVHAPLYSTFGALYSFAPKFSPVATSLGTDDGAFQDGQTDSYNIANYNKNSYTTNVYTRNQLALLSMLADPALQMALPNGLATANRVGAQANVIGSFKDFAEVQGLFTFLNQVDPLIGFKSVNYMEFGGGAKVDIFKAIGFSKPLEISGSYKRSVNKSDLEAGGSGELTSDFINAGLYVQYLPRLGFTAGFQMINTEYNDLQAAISNQMAPLMKGKQMQWMVGFDYSIENNAWLALNLGTINVSNEYNTSAVVAEYNASNAEDPSKAKVLSAATKNALYNLPVYYDVATDNGKYKHEFSQFIIEASLNVEF